MADCLGGGVGLRTGAQRRGGLTHVRPVVRLGGEDGNVYKLIGKVHAALEDAGLLSRAQGFADRTYYLGSHDEVLRLATEYVEIR